MKNSLSPDDQELVRAVKYRQNARKAKHQINRRYGQVKENIGLRTNQTIRASEDVEILLDLLNRNFRRD